MKYIFGPSTVHMSVSVIVMIIKILFVFTMNKPYSFIPMSF